MLLRRLLSTKRVVPFKLADIGEGIHKVHILKWFVKPGQHVRQFDRIAEVQSDKATVEITSRYDGTITALKYDEGSEATVGTDLLDIEINADDAPAMAKKEAPKRVSSDVSSQPSEVLPTALPNVRKYALDNGIADLSVVKAAGRISREEVDAYLQQRQQQGGRGFEPAMLETKRLTPFQQSMRDLMTRSAQIPHLGLSDDYHVSERKGLLARFIWALSRQLSQEFAHLNALYDGGDSVSLVKAVNVAIAVDTPHGLAVPVIKGCEARSEDEIAREIQRLAMLARENKLAKADLQGATVTVSNVGAVGTGTYARPVLMPPQVLIVAVGHTTKEESSGTFRVPVTWAADHRVIDGASIARLSLCMKRALK